MGEFDSDSIGSTWADPEMLVKSTLSTLCTLSACAAAGYPLWPVGFQGSFAQTCHAGSENAQSSFQVDFVRVWEGEEAVAAVQYKARPPPHTHSPRPLLAHAPHPLPSVGRPSVRRPSIDRHLSSPHTRWPDEIDRTHARPLCVAV